MGKLFTPIFRLASPLFDKLSYNELQEVRINSAARYKKDRDSTTYSVHVLDDLMENVNMWVKQLPIGDNQDSWYQHSSNVMIARRSIIFENEEYKRGYTDFNKAIETDTFDSYKKIDSKYVEPRKVMERTILFEFIVKYFGIETPGNKFIKRLAEDVLTKLETSLKKVVVPAKCRNTGLEACMQDINDTCTNSLNKNHDVNEGDTTDMVVESVNDDNGIALEHTLDNIIDDIDDDDDYYDMNDHIITTVDDDDNRSLLNSDCNKLALVNIFEVGKQKMMDQNIHEYRERKKKRISRHDKFMNDLYDKLLSPNQGLEGRIDALRVDTIASMNVELPSFMVSFRSIKNKTTM